MLNEYFAEGLGSFVFFVIILTKTEPLMFAVALLVGILIASIASQGHLNPAISTMAYMNGKFNGEKTLGYIGAQMIGAMCAISWKSYNTYKL